MYCYKQHCTLKKAPASIDLRGLFYDKRLKGIMIFKCLVDSNDPGSDRSQAAIDVLVSAIDLLNIVNR